jgi:hypothetical protein
MKSQDTTVADITELERKRLWRAHVLALQLFSAFC